MIKNFFTGLKNKLRHPNQTTIVLLTALFICIFHNLTFFRKISEQYQGQILFQISVFIILFNLLNIILNLAAHRSATKPLLITIILFSALHAHFTDSYGIVGDDTMIRNILKTDLGEAVDLLNIKLLIYFTLLGLLPAAILYFVRTDTKTTKNEIALKIRNVVVSLVVIIVALFSFNKTYASFLREHKPLRFYSNPLFFFYSSFKVARAALADPNAKISLLGDDAKIPDADVERELVIFVLGETARSDRLSLNGYGKVTNPLLQKEAVISFSDVYSCGTSTATSVPCMFSIFGRSAFDHEQAAETENLVDVLEHTGRINILWRDNNSDSKGVAIRVPFEDYKTPKMNTICDVECRDEGMLVGLQEYIDKQSKGDIFIVLHQMGNHGPAYYKRYPAKFEVFKPACQNNDLGECTDEEINNAYDNAILYTDYFLSQVIQLLKKNRQKFEAAMFYVSDHGESLGENGIYLHGLPYSIAPIEQRKIPLIMWFGDGILDDINVPALKAKVGQKYTHDNVFHTILGLMEVESGVYDKTKDIIEH